jgi:C4-dicarboxylate-specific signal transduction histidine kinase
MVAFGVLFAGGILVAAMGMAFLLPLMDSPGEAVFYVLTLLGADLLIVFLFGRKILSRSLLRPMERLMEDVRIIASGALDHRIRPAASRELQSVADSVNGMAERLIRDQEFLAANVRSLDRTNRALVEARAQVVRAARLASTGTLASGIAHELGNPLGAILAYVDVARSRAQARGADTELLDSIREEAVRIDRTIRSLLDFARSREGESGPHQIAEVVEKVRGLFQAQGRLDGIDACWNIPVDRLPDVFMDPHRLEQVLVNLLLNALDAVGGREDGWVQVSIVVEVGPGANFRSRRRSDPPGVDYAHRRRAMAVDEGGRVTPLATARQVVVLRVEDNGSGIPEASLEEVFDPFFTTKEPGKGTGLGLALSAQLVEAIGGEIQAGNREEGGAIFTIRLPEAEADADPPGGVSLLEEDSDGQGREVRTGEES